MRISSTSLLAGVLTVSVVCGQEPDRSASRPDAREPLAAPANEPPDGSLTPPARPRTPENYPIWRPVSRWLARTRAMRETQEVAERGDESPPVAPTPASTGSPPSSAAGESGNSGATRCDANSSASNSESGSNQNRAGSYPISSNPAAVNVKIGTRAIGRLLGFDDDSGIWLGGLWIGDAGGILSGGRSPGEWGLSSLSIADLYLDTQKLIG
jgi:hypothetical protein